MAGLHLSKRYDDELEAIRAKVLQMGGLVEIQMCDALAALRSGNAVQADLVISRDEAVNQFEIELDNACTELIVKRQPVAGDLRIVMAIGKIVTDLERIGDEVTKVARTAKNLQTKDFVFLNQYQSIGTIADTAQKMLKETLDAYARMDQEKAFGVISQDEVVDRAFHEMMRSLITYMMEDPSTITALMHILWAAKALERIGDHATNIGEYVIYIVDGDDIRHTDYARKTVGLGA